MKKLAVAVAVASVFVVAFSPSPSHCKSITTPEGDVYESACGRIRIGTDIYYWASRPQTMLYVGRVVKVELLKDKTIVWLRRANSKRFEPRLRKALCDWGWVKVKEGNK